MQQFLQNTGRSERQPIISPFHTGTMNLFSSHNLSIVSYWWEADLLDGKKSIFTNILIFWLYLTKWKVKDKKQRKNKQ